MILREEGDRLSSSHCTPADWCDATLRHLLAALLWPMSLGPRGPLLDEEACGLLRRANGPQESTSLTKARCVTRTLRRLFPYLLGLLQSALDMRATSRFSSSGAGSGSFRYHVRTVGITARRVAIAGEATQAARAMALFLQDRGDSIHLLVGK